MGINTERKSINLNKCSINTDVNKWIEQDIIVPDTKPDAMKIVNVTVTPYVSDIEVMENKIKVVGKVNYFVIYKVSDDNFGTRGLFVSYPYSEELEVNNVSKNMNARVIPVAKNVIYSLPNERKISIKSEIVFKVKVKEPVLVDVISSFNEESDIECKMCSGQFNNIICNKKSIIASKEDIMLPKEAEDFFEILKVDTNIKNTEFKESFNKIMVKGDIDIKIIYLSEDKQIPVRSLNTTVPFSAMIELEGINDNSKFDIDYTIQDFSIRKNDEITSTKTLTVDYQIQAELNMYETENVEYVEDFYSQNRELQYNNNVIEVVKQNIIVRKMVDVKENLYNVIPPETKVLDYDLDINNLTTTVDGNNVRIDGNAKLYLIVQNEETLDLDNKVIDLLINENVNLDNLTNIEKIYADLESQRVTVTQNGNDLDVKINLNIVVDIEDTSGINIIDNLSDSDLDISDLDTMNIYIVKEGDTLWNIAKKYKTSVDKIVKINGIDDPNAISIGQKIFIIR